LIDVEDPSTPVETAFIDSPGRMGGVALAGSYAFVADLDDGLRIFDIGRPATPIEIGSVDLPDGARAVAVAADMAYVAAGDQGLRIIDVSNPADPIEAGSFDIGWFAFAQGIDVDGNLAFVAAGGGGLWVVDVTAPAHPVTFAHVPTPNDAVDVAVSDGYAYVADSYSGLRIIDVRSMPFHTVGAFDVPGGVSAVALSGSFAYVAGDLNDHTLWIIDVSVPSSPVVAGSFASWGSIRDVAVSAGLAITLDGYSGNPESGTLRVFDIRNPASPVELAHRGGAFGALGGAAFSGDQVVVAAGSAGLRVLDVSTCIRWPPAPRRSSQRRTP